MGGIKLGKDCTFMTKRGCSFNGGRYYPIVDRCQSCERAVIFPAGQYCNACPDPTAKWSARDCNLATHIVRENVPKVAKTLDP